MRESNYRKFKITKKHAKLVGIAAAAVILAGIIFFFAFFHVSKVEVMESNHYSKEELKKMVLTGAFSSNSILAPITCSKDNVQNVPYIEGYSVSRSGRNSIVISVQEKNVVGCIPYLDNYVYFDRNGIFIEGDKTRDKSIPYFEGLQVKKVIMNEKLPVKDTILNTAVALSTIFAKSDLLPDYIQLEEDSTIDLIYGDITVKLGKDKCLEDKMSRTIAILPQITGEKGILHMENITESSKTVTFEKEEEEETATSEKWTGGYDENGDYTGDGEYDENGNYVGPMPEGTSEDSSDSDSGSDSEDSSSDSSDENDDSYDENSDSDSEDESDSDYQDYSDEEYSE